MPFKSKKQLRACFAKKDPKWNCRLWLKHTPDVKNLPETFRQFIEGQERLLYHVTRTSAVPSIKKKGILPFQTTNWVNRMGNRYGKGHIHACESLIDAKRWASKMDWALHKKMGSGGISIVVFQDDGEDPWEVDDADPISQMDNKGHWVKRMQRVDPKSITTVLPFTQDMVKELVNKL